ncbi:hypothetical protein D2E30_23910 [Mycobacteroides abscessus]|nr:hypothetical protein D2E30_23910 [Mycobacteroides abscessus]
MHVMFLGMRSRPKPRPLTGLHSELARVRQSWVGLEAVESAVEAMVAGCYRAERTIERAS